MSGPNADFTELAALTIDKYSSQIFDNVTKNLPFLFYLKKAGNAGITEVDGGLHILENLEYAENATFKWFNGYEELSLTPSEVFSAASFDWKQCNANVIFSGREVAINSGSETKQFDLIKNKTGNAERTMTNNMGQALFFSNTENDGKSIGGLLALVADDPTSGVVGGIDRSTTKGAFFRNQIYDFSTETVTPGADTIKKAFNTLYRRTSRNGDQTNLIIIGETYHEYWEESIQDQQRFQSSQEADVGFVYQLYKGAKVLFDPNCNAARAYFLNTKYIKLKAHSAVNMKTGKPRTPTNQDATVIPINWMGNMTISNPSLQGVMHA